jgi:hypothetical protein
MRLFLDTEWADPEGQQLVSLALVDSTGQHRFYAEVDPLPLAPTPFVREKVYPLLERGAAAMTPPDLRASLCAFLAGLPEPRLVLADHPIDFSLLRNTLSGFGSKASGEVPVWSSCEITQGDVLDRIEAYFEREDEARRRRHHAGVDAEALRRAFLSALEAGDDER